ncbi:MAG TPA: hypothetical protein PLK41_04595 [Defluviitoga tunisiensis]|nr:hypothetical protein [bacterium]HPP10250.1 hypothetical protein [Defluviitoga tunisiensis]
MIEDYLVRGSFVIKRVEDGYLISDLDLVVLLLSCFDDFVCYSAVLNPNNPNQVLFKITGNLDKLDKILKSLKNIQESVVQLSQQETERISFANKMNMVRNHLKILIDKTKGQK